MLVWGIRAVDTSKPGIISDSRWSSRSRANRNSLAGKGDYFRCDIESGPVKVVLLKPTTYMNRSGIAVADFVMSENLKPEEILVIADDFNLPLGRIRLRESGSDGGHNGLASIIYHLNSENFPRIRMGIGPVPEGIPAEDFVLERFAENQMADIKEMIGRASEAALMWLAEGYSKAAAQFNRAID